MIEIWKPIPGYEGLYEVSDFGNVKSLNYHREKREKMLKPLLRGNKHRQYYTVVLHKNGKPKKAQIHRLVALHFVPNPENKPTVNHIDNDPLNNHATNFEWCTVRENSIHGRTFYKKSSKYPGVYWNKNRKKWNAQININGKVKYLGLFHCEIDASDAYQNKLITI